MTANSLAATFDMAWSADSAQLLAAQASVFNDIHLLDLSYAAALRRQRSTQLAARMRLQQNPNDGEALRMLGEWYAFRGVWDYAINLLERARAAGAGVPPVALARCYWMNLNKAEAAREMRAALDSANGDRDALYLRWCLSAVEESQPQPLAACFKHPYARMGRRLMRKNWQAGVRLFDGAVDLVGGNPEERAALKLMCRNMVGRVNTDPEIARRINLEIVASAAPDSPIYAESCYDMGREYYRSGDFQLAVEWLKKAIAAEGAGLSESTDFAILILGDASWQLGRPDDAVKTWGLANVREPTLSRLKQRLRAVELGNQPPLSPVYSSEGR